MVPKTSIKAGVPQSNLLGPALYQIYTADLSFNDDTIIATFTDDIALLSTHKEPIEVAKNLQATPVKARTYFINLEGWFTDRESKGQRN